jgi:hypothetical protein
MIHIVARYGVLPFVLAALASLVTVGCNRTADAKEEQSVESLAKTGQTDAARVDKLVVYYFHNTRRCPTCLGIQKGIEDTIHEKFSRDIDAGMLEFQELNMEEEPNKKYVQQFQLSFSTMIVAAEAKGETRKWENAGKVWDFAQTPDELKAYVEKMIRQQLDLIGRNV